GFDIFLDPYGCSNWSLSTWHKLASNSLWYCRHFLLCGHLLIDPETSYPAKYYLGWIGRSLSSLDCLGRSARDHRVASCGFICSHLLMDSTALLAIVVEIQRGLSRS